LEERMMWEIDVIESQIKADEADNLQEEAEPLNALRGDLTLLNEWMSSLTNRSLKTKVKLLIKAIEQRLNQLIHVS